MLLNLGEHQTNIMKKLSCFPEYDRLLRFMKELDEMELSAQTMVSKQNGELVIEDTVIEDGDEIQLVQIIYGG